METVSGTITAVRKDRKGFQIDNNDWYSSWDPVTAERGDNVVFNYVQKGQYKNIKGKVNVSGSTGSAPVKAGGAKPNNFNLGVELGHAANLAQRVLEVMYCEDQLDAADVEVGSPKYWAIFNEQTLRAYKVMKALRKKVEGGSEEDEVPEVTVKVAAPPPTPAPEDVEDLF